MNDFIKNIKEIYFPHTDVAIYVNTSRFVIEIDKREVFSYKSKKGELYVKSPIPIQTAFEIRKLYDNAKLGGAFDGKD